MTEAQESLAAELEAEATRHEALKGKAQARLKEIATARTDLDREEALIHAYLGNGTRPKPKATKPRAERGSVERAVREALTTESGGDLTKLAADSDAAALAGVLGLNASSVRRVLKRIAEKK